MPPETYSVSVETPSSGTRRPDTFPPITTENDPSSTQAKFARLFRGQTSAYAPSEMALQLSDQRHAVAVGDRQHSCSKLGRFAEAAIWTVRMSSQRTQGRKTPKFADPWSMRRRTQPQRAAGLHGRPLAFRLFRHSGDLQQAWHPDEFDTMPRSPEPADSRSSLKELQRRRSKLLSAYRRNPGISKRDQQLIAALMHGTSLRAWARREGVSPQAIEDRIQRLKQAAPEFWAFWRRKNSSRSRR